MKNGLPLFLRLMAHVSIDIEIYTVLSYNLGTSKLQVGHSNKPHKPEFDGRRVSCIRFYFNRES